MNRLLRDAEHFEAKLGSLDGAADTGTYLVSLVKEKHVAAPPQPAVVVAPALPTRTTSAATVAANGDESTKADQAESNDGAEKSETSTAIDGKTGSET